MVAFFTCMALLTSGMENSQAQAGIFYSIGMFIFIMAIVIILIDKSKRADILKKTRENVLSLLEADEEVDLFDQQMSEEPIIEIKLGSEEFMLLTKDFVGKKYMLNGNQFYYFAKNKDISSFNFCKTSSDGANLLRASYAFDIQNQQNKVILNGIAETDEALEELISLIKKAQPEVIVTKNNEKL